MKHGDHFDGNLYPDILVLVTRDIDSNTAILNTQIAPTVVTDSGLTPVKT